MIAIIYANMRMMCVGCIMLSSDEYDMILWELREINTLFEGM